MPAIPHINAEPREAATLRPVQDDVATLDVPSALPEPLRRRVREALGHTPNWLELMRFVVVGASGYTLNLIVFATMIHAFAAGYLLAACVAFVFAVTNNFHWNRRWTFRAHEGPAHHQAIRFLCVCLGGFLIGVVLLSLLVDEAGFPKVAAEAIATAAAAPLTFAANKLWTFAT